MRACIHANKKIVPIPPFPPRLLFHSREFFLGDLFSDRALLVPRRVLGGGVLVLEVLVLGPARHTPRSRAHLETNHISLVTNKCVWI